MPAYNRADTILRSVRSVQAQTFGDWELLIVDDGSTDQTADLVSSLDTRIRVIRQDNQGITGARNTGLRASTGRHLAFLDSDDEWLPHHLELCTAFLRAFPQQQFVTTELREDLGHGRIVRHYHVETSQWYPEVARRIGSHALDLPAGETDAHMRVYQARESLGAWGQAIAERAGFPDARLYTGSIFPCLRFGYLMVMQGTVLTRAALEAIGPFDVRYRNVSDFGFMAELCRRYRANYLALPTCVKHELAERDAAMKEGHLSTGRRAVDAAQEMLRWFEELYGADGADDPEIHGLRAIRHVVLAKLCFESGRREEARAHLGRARSAYPGRLELRALDWYFAYAPEARWSHTLWHVVRRVKAGIQRRVSSLGVVPISPSVWTLLLVTDFDWTALGL